MCLVGQLQWLKLGVFRIASGKRIVVPRWSQVEASADQCIEWRCILSVDFNWQCNDIAFFSLQNQSLFSTIYLIIM